MTPANERADGGLKALLAVGTVAAALSALSALFCLALLGMGLWAVLTA